MLQCSESCIVLTGAEARAFRQRMDRPDPEAAQRRDQNLTWIAQHMVFEMAPTGFSVVINNEP